MAHKEGDDLRSAPSISPRRAATHSLRVKRYKSKPKQHLTPSQSELGERR